MKINFLSTQAFAFANIYNIRFNEGVSERVRERERERKSKNLWMLQYMKANILVSP
jgi:hypothetical protein